MQHLIGEKLEDATAFLKNKNIDFKIVENNTFVSGVCLVTNVQEKKGSVVLIVSNFIFELKES